jgi:hypothetical protein
MSFLVIIIIIIIIINYGPSATTMRRFLIHMEEEG